MYVHYNDIVFLLHTYFPSWFLKILRKLIYVRIELVDLDVDIDIWDNNRYLIVMNIVNLQIEMVMCVSWIFTLYEITFLLREYGTFFLPRDHQ